MAIKEFALKLPRRTASMRQYESEQVRRRKLRRERQARWRARHPLIDAWNNHRFNARNRGHVVEWTFEEFAEFCFETGYHVLRADGWVIDRRESSGSYCRANCQLLTKAENDFKGALEKYYTSAYASLLTAQKFA